MLRRFLTLALIVSALLMQGAAFARASVAPLGTSLSQTHCNADAAGDQGGPAGHESHDCARCVACAIANVDFIAVFAGLTLAPHAPFLSWPGVDSRQLAGWDASRKPPSQAPPSLL